MTQPEHPYQKVHSFLHNHPMAILSTVSAEGKPWGAAIHYVVDEDFKFYFVTRAETFKYHNLDKNPFAALTIADNETQTTVQVSGRVVRLPPQDYMEIVFNKLAHLKPKDDSTWVAPPEKIHKGNYMPLYLVPEHMQYANYKHIKSDDHANYIEIIISAPQEEDTTR